MSKSRVVKKHTSWDHPRSYFSQNEYAEHKWNMCERKLGNYNHKKEADASISPLTPEMRSYKCNYCKKYHQTRKPL